MVQMIYGDVAPLGCSRLVRQQDIGSFALAKSVSVIPTLHSVHQPAAISFAWCYRLLVGGIFSVTLSMPKDMVMLHPCKQCKMKQGGMYIGMTSLSGNGRKKAPLMALVMRRLQCRNHWPGLCYKLKMQQMKIWTTTTVGTILGEHVQNSRLV
jgi:hypothetical protein